MQFFLMKKKKKMLGDFVSTEKDQNIILEGRPFIYNPILYASKSGITEQELNSIIYKYDHML